MKIYLFPVGSYGDVHPFVGLGLCLRGRGHDVTVVTSEPFGELVERVGLKFLQLGSADEYDRLARNPDLWHPRRASQLIAREAILPGMRRQYALIAEVYEPGETLIVGSALGFGGRLAHEALGAPFISIHLQPQVFWSDYQSPLLAPGMLVEDWVPRWLKRFQFWLGNTLFFDPLVLPGLNAFRAELGLSPARNAWDMMHSPQQVIGMFPPWFAPPQPDWPPNVALADFPLWDERGFATIDPALDEFLDAGDPPIVFSPGSAMMLGHAFFQSAAEACTLLDRRGLLLTRYPEQIPANLPDAVRHFAYAPFSEVLPRCAAFVHHGGIGSTAQGLAAGIPQLIMPMAHDQPDNARRVKRFGAGDHLPPAKFRGPQVAKRLAALLDSDQVQMRCREMAGRFQGVNGIAAASDIIEGVLDDNRCRILG